jgi:hypothetical protein
MIFNSSGNALSGTGFTGSWLVRTGGTGGSGSLPTNAGNLYLTYNTSTYEITAASSIISDSRMKMDIGSLDSSESYVIIKEISPKQYKLKSNPNHLRYGVIAEEIKQISGLSNIVLEEENYIPFINTVYQATVLNEFISKSVDVSRNEMGEVVEMYEYENSRILEYRIHNIDVLSLDLNVDDLIMIRNNINGDNHFVKIKMVDDSNQRIIFDSEVILDENYLVLTPRDRIGYSMINNVYNVYLICKKVNNILTLNYDDLFIRHLSASQEIIKRLEELENKVSSLSS